LKVKVIQYIAAMEVKDSLVQCTCETVEIFALYQQC